MTPRRTIIEIAANSVRSAIAAQEGGADRVELCEFLEGGGVTPSFGTISLCRDKLNIPLHVLIRPRIGNFVYSEEEREIMLRDISICQQLACDGVVIGALDADGHIDQDLCRRLIDATGDMRVVFHRAFDCVTDLQRNWLTLHQLGVHGLLTSGTKNSALEGAPQIAAWTQANTDVEIIAGAGVTPNNVATLLQQSRAHAVHASAKQVQKTTSAMRVISGLHGDFWQSDQEIVEQLVKAVRAADQA